MTNSHDSNSNLAPPAVCCAKQVDEGLLLFVQVQPGAKRTGIIGLIQGSGAGTDVVRLKVAVREKAVDGAANEALRKVLAEALRLSKTNVTLIKGQRSRQKTLLITGLPEVLITSLSTILNERND